MRILEDPSFILGLLGASLTLVGAGEMGWKRGYVVLVSGASLSVVLTPLVAEYWQLGDAAVALVSLLTGLIGIKITDWITQHSLEDIGQLAKVVLQRFIK
jgi:hypothetical protein